MDAWNILVVVILALILLLILPMVAARNGTKSFTQALMAPLHRKKKRGPLGLEVEPEKKPERHVNNSMQGELTAIVSQLITFTKRQHYTLAYPGTIQEGGQLTTTLALVQALSGPALEAHYVTNGIAHARLLAQKGCKVFVPGGMLRPNTEAIVGAAAVASLQAYNFTKAFLGANGVDLQAGFTTPDPEEAAVKATAVRRARESWFLADSTKFARVYPAVITELRGSAILTDRCPSPQYAKQTLVKEAEL